MTVYRLKMWLLAGLAISLSAATANAQLYDWVDTPEHDLQFFSPVDIDFDGTPVRRSSGYFFNFHKLNWAMTGERTTIGNGQTDDGSFNPFRVFITGGAVVPVDPNGDADDDDQTVIGGTIIDPNDFPVPLFPSSITNSPPRATFGWGERYEFGHFHRNAGWKISILDGPIALQNDIFGYGATQQDDTGIPQLLSPLGSVRIVFNDPQDLMRGFIDVVDGLVVDGPPTDPLESDSNGDGVLDGDGFADDIDRDGHYGPSGIEGGDPGEIPDLVGGGLPHDFDDVVRLPISFQTLAVNNITQLNGIEFLRTHRLTNRHHMVKHQNNELEFSYGARYVRLRDQFIVNGVGGVLGDSFWDTRIDNNLVGPQVGLKWLHQKDRLRLDWGGRFLFGYNVQNWEQSVGLGEDLIPGQANHSLYMGPTTAEHGRRDDDFSPLVEMRVEASYQVTGSIAAKLGYNAMFIDNIRRASQQVDYTLPRMGFIDGGTQDIFINGVTFGVDVVY